jgi:hypothetical protein
MRRTPAAGLAKTYGLRVVQGMGHTGRGPVRSSCTGITNMRCASSGGQWGSCPSSTGANVSSTRHNVLWCAN